MRYFFGEYIYKCNVIYRDSQTEIKKNMPHHAKGHYSTEITEEFS